MNPRLKVGDKVKYSGYIINHKVDAWNNAATGQRKLSLKNSLEDTKAVRGIVGEIDQDGHIVVYLADGRTSRSLDYVWEIAED